MGVWALSLQGEEAFYHPGGGVENSKKAFHKGIFTNEVQDWVQGESNLQNSCWAKKRVSFVGPNVV